MSLYDDHAAEPLLEIMHPHQRIKVAVPASLLSRYWRPGVGFVQDAEWHLLRPLAEVRAQVPGESPASRLRRQQREYLARCEAWSAAVRETSWGRDPLWQYGSRVYDDAGASMDPRTGKKWWPRVVLMAKYGTVDLAEYAARQGLPYPKPADLGL